MNVAVSPIDRRAGEDAAGFGGAPFLGGDDLEDQRHREARLFLKHPLQQLQLFAQGRVRSAQALDLAHRVQHRCVIASAEATADLRQRAQRQRLGEIHRHLTRLHHGRRAARRENVGAADAVVAGDQLLDVLDLDPLGFARADQIADRRLRRLDAERRR